MSTALDGIPTFEISREEFDLGIMATRLFHKCGLCSSHREAIRLCKQGGLKLDGLKIELHDFIAYFDLEPGIVQVGKKRHMRIVLT